MIAVSPITSYLNGPPSRPGWLGRFVYTFLPIRRRTVLENMRRVFGSSADEKDIRRLAQSFYEHIARVLLENFCVAWMSDRQITSRVKVIGAEIAIQTNAERGGVLFLTGHFGNWELTPIGATLLYPQFRNRFFILRRPLVHKWLERILFSRFYRVGLNIIPKRNSADRVIDALENRDAVAFIMDQYAKPGRDGIVADFFGTPAGTFKSLALVAARTQAPVIPLVCYRDAKGCHVMEFKNPLPFIHHDDPDIEILRNTQQYNRVLESFIREHPDQWLWFHRRWKHKAASRRAGPAQTA